MHAPFERLGGTPGIASTVGPLDRASRNEILKGLSRRVHGVFASPKNGVPIPWRNRDERDLLGLLEIDSRVTGFAAMAEKVTFVDRGERRTHVPSVRITTRDGEAVLDARSPDDGIAMAMALVYGDRGIPYRAVDRRSLRLLPRHANVRFVLGYRGFKPAREDATSVVGAMSQGECMTIGSLAARIGGIHPVPTVCALALRGVLEVDLSAPVPTDMKVKLAPRDGR